MYCTSLLSSRQQLPPANNKSLVSIKRCKGYFSFKTRRRIIHPNLKCSQLSNHIEGLTMDEAWCRCHDGQPFTLKWFPVGQVGQRDATGEIDTYFPAVLRTLTHKCNQSLHLTGTQDTLRWKAVCHSCDCSVIWISSRHGACFSFSKKKKSSLAPLHDGVLAGGCCSVLDNTEMQ